MKIVYGPEIFLQKYGGISRYFSRLANGIGNRGHDVEVVAPIHLSGFLEDVRRDHVYGRRISHVPRGFAKIARNSNVLLGRAISLSRLPNIFHPTYFSHLDRLSARVPRVVTVHDMIHEIYGDRESLDWRFRASQKASSIRSADLLVAISENTRNDLMDFFPRLEQDRVMVIPLGVDEAKRRPVINDKPRERSTLLYVGQRFPVKNFGLIAQALSCLNKSFLDEVDLVIFGGPPLSSDEMNALTSSGLSFDRITHETGDDSKLEQWYLTASALIYPSKYEGFGLPVLEAMAHGCPVLASNSSSIPEVGGGAAIYFNPTEPESLANAISGLLNSEEMSKRMALLGLERAKEFSWEKCVDKTLDAYLKVTGH